MHVCVYVYTTCAGVHSCYACVGMPSVHEPLAILCHNIAPDPVLAMAVYCCLVRCRVSFAAAPLSNWLAPTAHTTPMSEA